MNKNLNEKFGNWMNAIGILMDLESKSKSSHAEIDLKFMW